MANSLGRAIERHEIVIINPDYIIDEFNEDTRFQCEHGFGMMPFTAGHSITGIWLATGEREGYMSWTIEAGLTEAWQEEHGKFGEKDAIPNPDPKAK